MSVTQATVTNTRVAVKYRRNDSSLSIDMSADNRTTNLGRHIGRVLVDISTDVWPISRSICQMTHLGWHINQHSTNMLADISVYTRQICQLIHRTSVGRYVERYIGRGVHKIHMIRSIEHHLSILVAFCRKNNIISAEYRNKTILYQKKKT